MNCQLLGSTYWKATNDLHSSLKLFKKRMYTAEDLLQQHLVGRLSFLFKDSVPGTSRSLNDIVVVVPNSKQLEVLVYMDIEEPLEVFDQRLDLRFWIVYHGLEQDGGVLHHIDLDIYCGERFDDLAHHHFLY